MFSVCTLFLNRLSNWVWVYFLYIFLLYYILMFSPLEQFEVIKLSFFGVSNLNFYLFYYLCIIVILFSNSTRQSLFVFSYSNLGAVYYIHKQLKSLVVGSASVHNLMFIWMVSLFYFLFMSNIFGLIPMAFTLTAHLIISMSCSFIFFFWINFVYFLRFFEEWGSLFLPSGTPTLILWLIVPIEILSYFSRMFSLAIRLFANMMSGHTLLFILISFFFINFLLNFLFIVPIVIIHLIIVMEFGVAFLQIYVFLVLSVLYLNDLQFVGSH